MSSKKRPRVEACGPLEDEEGESEKEEDDGEEEEEDEDTSDSNVESDLEVNVQFEVKPIVDHDRHGITRLLQQLFLKASVDLSGLTDLITSQDGIGSIIQVVSDTERSNESSGEEGGSPEQSSSKKEEEEEEEEEELCGVVSVINLTHHKDNVSVQSLIHHILNQCQKHAPSCYTPLSQLLSHPSHHVGLLINERFLNVPPHVAPPLLTSLLGEVKEASKKSQPFNIHSYIVIARSYLSPTPLPTPHKRRKKQGGGGGGGHTDGSESSIPLLDCLEYETLQEESTLTFSYPVSGEGGESDTVFGGGWGFDDEPLPQTRTVMVIPQDRIEPAIAQLRSSLR